MFQFSDDIDDDLLEDALSVSTDQIENEDKTCSTGVIIKPTINDLNITLEDFDEDDDVILSTFEDSNTSLPKCDNSTCDLPLQKFNTLRQSNGQTGQTAPPSIYHDSASSPVVAKHKSADSHESPNSSKYSKIEYERKFPGPAGLILKKSEDNFVIPGEKRVSSMSRQIEVYQVGDSLFESNPSWRELFNDAKLNSSKLLQRVNEFTINNVKKLNLVKDISWKIPIFAAVIYNLDSSVCDPTVTLKDPSGEIRGTLHKDLWDQYNHLLLAGSTLLLRQVSVMSMINSRKLYLNITMNNIVTIYTPPTDDKSLTITRVRTISENDILNETKTDRNIRPNNSSASSIYSAKNFCLNANTRSNVDLLNIIKNSNILDSPDTPVSLKTPPSKNCIPEFNSNSVAVCSSVVDVAVKSSPNTKSCENYRASLILNELEGLNTDSLFDDFQVS